MEFSYFDNKKFLLNIINNKKHYYLYSTNINKIDITF